MTNTEKETLITMMGETLAARIELLEDDGDIISLYEEWVVDDVDPQDGEYEFMFFYCLPQTP